MSKHQLGFSIITVLNKLIFDLWMIKEGFFAKIKAIKDICLHVLQVGLLVSNSEDFVKH